MKAVAKSIKWMFENFMGPILVGIVLLYVSKDSLDSLLQALSKTGIGFIAWIYADAALPHWQLGVVLFTCLAVLLVQVSVFRRQSHQLQQAKQVAEDEIVRQRRDNEALTAELAMIQAKPVEEKFEPDRFEAMVLRYFWESDYGAQLSTSNVSWQTTFSTNQSALILEKLYGLGLLADAYTNHGRLFYLSEKGRQFASEMAKATERKGDWDGASETPVMSSRAIPNSVGGAGFKQQTDAAIGVLLDGLGTPEPRQAESVEPEISDKALDLIETLQKSIEQHASAFPKPEKISVKASKLQKAIQETSQDRELRPLEQTILRHFAANPHTRYSGNTIRYRHHVSASDAAQVLLDLCNQGLLYVETGERSKKPLECLYLVTKKGLEVAKTIR